MEYHVIALYEEKFLDIPGTQRNGIPSSHIYGEPYHDNIVYTLVTVWHEKNSSLHYPLFRV